MATEQLLLLIVGAVALLALLLGLWLLLVSNEQRKEIRRLYQLLAEPEEAAVETYNRRERRVSAVKPVDSPMFREVRESFSARLNAVERQKKAPAATPLTNLPRNPSEKYGYVASLASQGMNAAQIADALQMAPAEVDQLLRLANLKQGS